VFARNRTMDSRERVGGKRKKKQTTVVHGGRQWGQEKWHGNEQGKTASAILNKSQMTEKWERGGQSE